MFRVNGQNTLAEFAMRTLNQRAVTRRTSRRNGEAIIMADISVNTKSLPREWRTTSIKTKKKRVFKRSKQKNLTVLLLPSKKRKMSTILD